MLFDTHAHYDHPWFAGKGPEIVKNLINELLEDPRTVAVKTGFDFSQKKLPEEERNRQAAFFRYMTEQANLKNLPLILHVRSAVDATIEALRETSPNVEAVAHCYTYDLVTAKKMMAAGVTRFGMGGKITFPEMGALRKCVKYMPLSAILIETDAPFVKPVGYTEDVNTSRTLLQVVDVIPELKGISRQTVMDAVNQNAADFYRIMLNE